MFMWPRPFLGLTAYKRCRPGVHYWLATLEELARRGDGMSIMLKRYLLWEIVLFWLPQDDLAETVDPFSDLNLGWKVPGLFLLQWLSQRHNLGE
jgi:hypothetical protein